MRQHRQEQKIDIFFWFWGVRDEELFLNPLTNDIQDILLIYNPDLELSLYSYLWKFWYSSLLELHTNTFISHARKHHMIY